MNMFREKMKFIKFMVKIAQTVTVAQYLAGLQGLTLREATAVVEGYSNIPEYKNLTPDAPYQEHEGFLEDIQTACQMGFRDDLLDINWTIETNEVLEYISSVQNSTDTECSICYTNKITHSISCTHTFCQGCITKWCTEVSAMCPICRSDMEKF